MMMTLKTVGAPSRDELRACPAFPGDEALRRGPVAVIECIEEIPCNPCEGACPFHAITVGLPITNLPRIDVSKCVGCGRCVAACSGLCIYVRDYTYSETTCTVSFPFEYLPLPEKGQRVEMVDRLGNVICPGTVLRVSLPASADHTAVITAEYDKAFFEEVVNMKRLNIG